MLWPMSSHCNNCSIIVLQYVNQFTSSFLFFSILFFVVAIYAFLVSCGSCQHNLLFLYPFSMKSLFMEATGNLINRFYLFLQTFESELSVRVASLLQQRVALSLENCTLKQQVARLQQEKLIMECKFVYLSVDSYG